MTDGQTDLEQKVEMREPETKLGLLRTKKRILEANWSGRNRGKERVDRKLTNIGRHSLGTILRWESVPNAVSSSIQLCILQPQYS